jgi:hypothetical protein
MRIYATPFKDSDKSFSGPSADSGFDSLASVAAALGDPTGPSSNGVLVYGEGDDLIAFSAFVFCIAPAVNIG